MVGYVDGIDWINAEAMRYWSFSSSYTPEKKKAEVQNAIYSGDFWGALKVDGYYQRLVKDEDGNCFMIARSKNVKGEAVNKIDWVPQIHDFMEKLPNGTVLLTECYLPGNEGSKNITSLLGCLKEKCIARQEKGQKLNFYVFDICAWNGKSFVEMPARERFEKVAVMSRHFQHEFVQYAEYFNGQKLWDMLQEYLADGREGIVITRSDCPIYFKRTPAHMTIKIKKELQETIDVIVVGSNPPTRLYNGQYIDSWKYWENLLTGEKLEGDFYKEYADGASYEPVTKAYYNGWAGSIKIGMRKDDKVVTVGSLSGLTEEVLQNWESYCGKVCEITCMEVMKDTGGLRHPRFVRWREDKTPRDATSWYEVFGKE